jgi:hypothetical protein
MRSGVIANFVLGIICCISPVILIGVIIGIIFLNKRLSQSSWFRKILAIITGVLVDLGGTNIIAGIYAVIFAFGMAFNLAGQHLSKAEIQEALKSELTSSSFGMSIPMIVMGLLLSILGGYSAGKIARQNEILYGLGSSIGVMLVSVTLTFLLGLSTKSPYPIWQSALSFVASIGCSILGGYLAYLQRKRKQAKLMTNNIEMPQTS